MTHPYLYAGLTQKGMLLARVGIRSSDPMYIISVVANIVGVPQADMLSRSRKRELVEARCIAVGLILKVDPEYGLVKLGNFFGRHHSSMIYNRDLFKDLYGTDRMFTKKAKKVLDEINLFPNAEILE